MARSTPDVLPPRRRIVARHTAAWLVCAVAGAWCASAALAQEAGGPIVIPGPGEQNPADLARMTAMATSSNASPRTINPQFAATLAPPAQSSTPQATDRFTRLSNASGAIVIPGTDEASASGAPNVPANTTVIQQASPANTASLTRVNMNPALAASQVVPVVVTSMPAPYVPAVTPAVTAASSVEIDSLASRGEPPELGASAAGRNPAPHVAAAPAQTTLPVKNQAQALAEAAQRAQAIQALQQAQAAQAVQALQRAQTPQPAPKPVLAASRVQPVQTAAAIQASQPAQASQPVPEGQEDGQLIHAAALDFLKQQANGLPGQVELSVAQAFPRGLAACDTLQAFMPPGARLWGRTTVAVRCTSGHPWTVWLQAKVSIHATYYVAARAMMPGEVISDADLVPRDGDLTMLPASIVTVPSQAVGSVTLMRVSMGFPLRQDMLKSAAQVTAGQSVRVVAQGDGFSISSEGSALSNATPGQPVRVKTSTGQILMGIVKDSSTVQIQM
jgi:flagella basal body P-ring formation protein FlgA